MKLCSWCDTSFKPAVTYQIYCSEQCRELATKEKIAERHKVLKRKKRLGKVRVCRNCQDQLSAYNDNLLCDSCEFDPVLVNKALKELKRLGIIEYEQE